jgi:hypothetical protein
MREEIKDYNQKKVLLLPVSPKDMHANMNTNAIEKVGVSEGSDHDIRSRCDNAEESMFDCNSTHVTIHTSPQSIIGSTSHKLPLHSQNEQETPRPDAATSITWPELLPSSNSIINGTNVSSGTPEIHSKSRTCTTQNGTKLPNIKNKNCNSSRTGPAASKIYQISQDKNEQRYDMNLVPKVKRNAKFLRKWREGTAVTTGTSPPIFSSIPNLVPCDDASTCSKSTSSEHLPCHQDNGHQSKPCNCQALFDEETPPMSATAYVPTQYTAPFAEDAQSCIWVPSSRADWEDCIDELVNVCTAAAWHKERNSSKKKTKDFSPPISHIYVKDRLDIDDPLKGYQIRHKTGGWLQGFVMMTNFTIWTHYFKWDSLHHMNGINRDNLVGVVDDGSLTKALESQPRSGDPHGTGVVWPTIAEISLVGALGCGEYLIQMALEDIERRGSYEFVVLEATETSRPFYEKFGFVRVGAVCKYGKQEDLVDEASSVEETGYRHWTYANESKARLNEHGGPSCMMARKIHKRDVRNHRLCPNCNKVTPSFTDKLSNYFVLKKPKIEPLGTSGNRKRSRTVSAGTLSQALGEKTAKMAKTTKDPAKKTLSGRQSRIPTRLEESPENVLRGKNPNSARSSRNSACASLAVVQRNPTPSTTSSRVSGTKPILRKQKIANMYRDPKKEYYYNKVVAPKSGNNNSFKSKYYFVLNFDENQKNIRIIPLYRRGTFKGRREGREKWKATILPRNDQDEKKWLKRMDVITVPASSWKIVASYMVTKCSSVGEESWDILERKI